MDYMPQFGQNTNETMPADDSVMQLELKRRLARAEALRNQSLPQGQMIGGHYVAPSWTQQLDSAVGQYLGAKGEREAMKQYGEYQKTKAQKQADALRELSGALEPKQVEQYADYNESGNMPLVETKMQQPTASNLTQALLNYGQQTGQPGVGEKAVMSRIEALNKAKNAPITLAAGGKLINPDTYEVLAENPKDAAEKSMFGTVSPSDFTPQSLAKFQQTKDYRDLVAVPKQATPANPYYQAIPTGQGYARFNARTGQMENMPLNGQAVLPAAQTPELQGNIASAKFQGEAGAKREFNMAGAPDIVNEARAILTSKTKPTGSGIGTIADIVGATVGYSPSGAAQADKLRAIGGQLVAKMPRMEGPQSDRDVALYTQMAGQIGDSTIPVARRLEALKTVEGIVNKYAPKQQKALSSQDQQALQWANSNPNDPRAAAIKRKLGVQ